MILLTSLRSNYKQTKTYMSIGAIALHGLIRFAFVNTKAFGFSYHQLGLKKQV